MIRLLTTEEKLNLADVFMEEFENTLPPVNANVIGLFENDELIGFLVAETLLRVGMVWTKPEIRNTMQSALATKELAQYAYQSIPQGASAIVIASEKKFEPLLKRLGMKEVIGKIFRKDF
jgi:hypothetical protein